MESKTRSTSKVNFVLDSTTFLNFRVPDSTTSSKIACLCTVMHIFLLLFLTFFPKMNKLVETPLDDHSRSLYTVLVHKHYSLAQLNIIIAKLSSFLSSFILKKLYKYFSLTSNISDEIIQSLPKHNPLSNISEPTTVLFLLLHFFLRPLLTMYSKLQTLTCVSILSPVLLTNLLVIFSLFSVHMLNSPPIPIYSTF